MEPDLSPLSAWRERHRVRIGFFLGLLFIWRAQPRFLPFLALGLLAALAGLLLRQWAAGCVKKMDALATRGPYALVRHPLYAGSFLMAAGFLLAASSLNPALARPYLDRTLLFWACLWLLIDGIYLPKIAKEERDLRAKFGPAFDDYAQKVPRFLPREFRFSSFDFGSFDREIWLRNREYWSIAGYLLIALLLIARYHYAVG